MSLDTAREALLDDAQRRAQEIVALGEEEAARRLEEARREADELVARARAEGEVEGRLQAARVQAVQRFTAHMQVLGAQRASYDALLARARADALALRGDPAYPELLDRLAAAARRDLGPDAEVTIDPAALGGVLARAGSRAVDYTLVALAERCVQDLGARVGALWA
jgi:vacuolar-type H+-ATPase subunit E/Vma4